LREITKLPISNFVWMFIGYLAAHILIGIAYKKNSEALKKDSSNTDLQKHDKIWGFLYKWFPAIYVVGILISFYF